MNKLSKKFIIGIAVILTVSSLCSIWFNTSFIERYYLYQKKNSITKICNNFTKLLQQENSPQTAIDRIETSNKVIIANIETETDLNSDNVNSKIQSAFQEKGIGFQKYWFWEEDYKKVLGGENKIRLYKQEKLNYSLLIDYIQQGSNLYAVTMIVPNISDAFHIANNFLMAVTFSTIIFAVIFIILLTRQITKPLVLFEDFAKRMKDNEFTPIEIQTKDELENVALSLNSMGNQIMKFQKSLEEKNFQMEQLLDNVAHDLKTPISLIQLYGKGIKDGIDDGTFLDIILKENNEMASMVNRLLYLSQLEKKQYDIKQVDLSGMIRQLSNRYSILASENQMEIHSSIEKDITLYGVEELLRSLFSNLIINAVKYSSGNEIIINLFKQRKEIIFTIINETENTQLDIEKIWTPYYVGEKSRNKKLSGTGLGLSIVYKICENQHYTIQGSLQENKINFTLSIPIENNT